MDPLSVAGLTLAVFDQLWKLGNHTAVLISNFRDFDNDVKLLENKIRDENIRTRALQMLLFEPSTVYGGNSMFEYFDSEVQEQIHMFLEQASDILSLAHDLLVRRLERSPANSDWNLGAVSEKLTTLHTLPSGSTISSERRPSPFQRLRWSFCDKKRVESIVRDYGELNARIHESIKLWCLSTSIGVDLQHLKHLESDENSRILGFDVDAKLQIATTSTLSVSRSLEMQDPDVQRSVCDVRHSGDALGVFKINGQPVVAEYRQYSPGSPSWVALDDRTRDVVERLANILHQPKEVIFRTPSCVGWVRHTQLNRIAFIFSIPPNLEPNPLSLLHMLSSKEVRPPSLSQRFQLAHKLAQCISQLQLVKWWHSPHAQVHESFRSENIVFFPTAGSPEASLLEEPDVTEPWVFGFDLSRPEKYFSSGETDDCVAREIYRHPDRQRQPSKPFSKIYDIYALGIVLLEIGLWQPALSLEKHNFSRASEPAAIRNHMVNQANKRLGSKMGEKYKMIVLKCLQGSFNLGGDANEDVGLQQAFRAQVVDVLRKATECI
ncbi:hypothetical protein LLEC1_03547 [Akanthomyces lecanii]|uniref:Protein kinase domain-containing protein n=1 Tax=Cordyceps confragosa TaxID=2714763 RepID=A0A179I739_CORDF|nr:hypothetical protein LLEC1_03547 [Akanthomyces lecanii]